MKKFWLSSLILIFTLYNANAQKIRLGVFVDPLFSYLKTDLSSIEPDGGRVGVNFGLMLDNFFSEHYAFTTGISLQSMGGSLNYVKGKEEFLSTSELPSLRPNTIVKYKLQYLHIPFALKMRTTEVGYVTFFAQLGLDPMINVKANADISSENLKNIGVGKEIHLFYMAYHIGAGVEYKILGNTKLMTGITYMNGFTDVTSNSGNSAEKTVMHCFELRMGVIF